MVKKRSRHSKHWSSFIVGTHAAGHKGNRAQRRTSRQKVHTLASNNNELKQMNVHSTVSKRASHYKTGRSFTKEALARRKKRTFALGAIIVCLVVALAFALGTCTYGNSLNAALSLDDDVKRALSTPENDKPDYTLIAGLANDDKLGQSAGLIMLARIDEQNNQISLLGIPDNTRLSLSDGKDHMLRDAIAVGGEKELISAVGQLLGIGIHHYARTTEADFVTLIDTLGGISVRVNQRVDDPRVSTIVLNAGEQMLNGEQALTFVSAFNYQNGHVARLDNQKQALEATMTKVNETSSFESLTTADALSKMFKTDYTYDDLKRLSEMFSASTQKHYITFPGSEVSLNNKTYYLASASEWSAVKEKFIAGEDPHVSIDTSAVDKAKTTVEVLNGAGLDGSAAQVAEKLSQAGWDVTDTGNAPSFVYDETLVVYKEESDNLAAEAVVQDLGAGRAVYSGSFYSLTTNLQVYVGKDWTPSG